MSSNRKLTIPNDASTIKVSPAVLDRLKESVQPSKQESGQTEVKRSVEPPKTSSVNLGNIDYGNTLTSIQVLRAKEKELKDTDEYWAERFTIQEDHYKKVNKAFEEEYQRALKELPPLGPGKAAPCTDRKAKLLQCYTSNPKSVLLCAKEVADFSNCIEDKHLG